MKFKNITLATAILLALTGCGSSGGGSSNNNNPAPNAEIQNQLNEQKSLVDQLKQRLSEAQKQQKEAEENLANAKNRSAQDLEVAKKQLADSQAKLNEITKNLMKAEQDLKNNENTATSLRKQLTDVKQQLTQAKAAKEAADRDYNDQLAKNNQEISKIRDDLENKTQDLIQAESKVNELQATIDNLPTNQQQFNAQLSALQDKYKALLSQKEEFEKELNEKLTDKENQLKSMQSQRDEINQKFNQVSKELSDRNKALDQAKERETTLLGKIDSISKNISDLKIEKDNLERDLKDKLSGKESELLQSRQALEKVNAELKSRESDLSNVTAQLENEKSNKIKLQESINSFEKQVNNLTLEKDNLDKALNAQINEKQNELNRIQGELTKITTAFNQASEDLKLRSDEVKRLQSDQKSLEQARDKALSDLDNARKEKASVENELNKKLKDKDLSITELENAKAKATEDLNKAQKALSETEKNLANVEASKSEVENQLSQAKKDLEKTTNDLKAAEIAKDQAEKKLTEKEALETVFNKDGAYDLALKSGLSNEEADLFATKYANRTKAELHKLLVGWHYRNALAAVIAPYYDTLDLPKKDIENEAKKYFDEEKSLEEVKAIFEEKVKEKHEKLVNLAKTFGLSESNAERFISVNNELSDDKLKEKLTNEISNLTKRAQEVGMTVEEAEKFAKENIMNDFVDNNLQIFKQNKLINLVKELGISDYAARQFVANNSSLDEKALTSKLQSEMSDLRKQAQEAGMTSEEADTFAKENIARNPEYSLSPEYSLRIFKYNKYSQLLSEADSGNFNNEINVNDSSILSLSINEFKKLLDFTKIAKDTMKDKSSISFSPVKFARRFLNLTPKEFNEKINQKNDFGKLAEQYGVFGDEGFVGENFDKSTEEQIVALTKRIKRDVSGNDSDELYAPNQIVTTPLVDNSSSYLDKVENANKVYNQKYSITQGTYEKRTYNDYGSSELFNVGSRGLHTLETGLPNEGKATYKGKAFTYESEADFTYNVDFAGRKGSGKIDNLKGYGDITLDESSIKVGNNTKRVSISGNASSTQGGETNGSYNVNFYGPKAEEVGGVADFYFDGQGKLPSAMHGSVSTKVGFGGTRGEIQK